MKHRTSIQLTKWLPIKSMGWLIDLKRHVEKDPERYGSIRKTLRETIKYNNKKIDVHFYALFVNKPKGWLTEKDIKRREALNV